MDLFKFNPSSQTYLEQGQPINGYSSVMWTERYADTGEIKIEAPLSTGLRDFLPTGTFVGQVASPEVMIIESHEIQEDQSSDPTLVISGRSFESYLENRQVGTNLVRANSTIVDYVLPAQNTWTQLVTLINDHILNTQTPNDALTAVQAVTSISGSGTSEARTIEVGDLLKAVQDLLAIDDVGIKTIRRANVAFAGGSTTTTYLRIFSGTDLSSSITFSWNAGDIESGDYLFSDKKLKNSALIKGRYIWTMVDQSPAVTGYNRRIMLVNGSDIDEKLNAPPTGTALTNMLATMATRGRQALKSQNRIALSRADISDLIDYRYRRDFNVGDLVTLDANYGQTLKTRIVEYVEIEDENGASGHPTLEIPGG